MPQRTSVTRGLNGVLDVDFRAIETNANVAGTVTRARTIPTTNTASSNDRPLYDQRSDPPPNLNFGNHTILKYGEVVRWMYLV